MSFDLALERFQAQIATTPDLKEDLVDEVKDWLDATMEVNVSPCLFR